MPSAIANVPRHLYRWGADWLNERARLPGIIMALGVLALAPVAHLTVGTVLAANWVIGKFPAVFSMVQAIRIHQFRRWSRPQSYQRPDVVAVDRPPEAVDEEWKVPGWQRELTRAAEHNKALAVLDDWLNERSRVPGFVLDVASVVLGYFAAVPTAAIFVLNWVLGRLPQVNSITWAVINKSFRRYNRPGSFQRRASLRGLRSLNALGRYVAGPAAAAAAEPVAAGPGVAGPAFTEIAGRVFVPQSAAQRPAVQRPGPDLSL